ncbi:hypothetical protein T05_2144 [Trichinella murrelli]|uniref:Uncharacterized protein n=1 Tax=Trichinella murrelli TaxID=144512 RepID=A0A0V0TM57_9BILA|nr:hypothetical protein T05_2144 [Trichinella murrelli]
MCSKINVKEVNLKNHLLQHMCQKMLDNQKKLGKKLPMKSFQTTNLFTKEQQYARVCGQSNGNKDTLYMYDFLKSQ